MGKPFDPFVKCGELQAENARLREELAQSQATIERSVADGIDKVMAMSDDQISALCAFSGHHPDDEARIGRLCMEVATLKVQLTAAQADAARYRKIRSECGFDQQHFSVAISNPYSWEVARTGEELDAAIDAITKEQS